MNRFCIIMLLLAFVVTVAVFLYLFVSISSLLEIFFIALGLLCISWGVIKLDDQIHLHKVKQQHREMTLRGLRQRVPPSSRRF